MKAVSEFGAREKIHNTQELYILSFLVFKNLIQFFKNAEHINTDFYQADDWVWRLSA